MLTSDETKEITSALIKFQSSMSSIKKDAENPHFRHNYTSLAGMWDAIRKPLGDCKLAVIQTLDGEVLITRVEHETGQFFESMILLACKDPTPQLQGSAITYARRYALAAILGLSSSDDDDGEGAERAAKKDSPLVAEAKKLGAKEEPEQKAPPVTPRRDPRPMTPAQAGKIMGLLALSNDTQLVQVANDFWGKNEKDAFKSASDISMSEASQWITHLGKTGMMPLDSNKT